MKKLIIGLLICTIANTYAGDKSNSKLSPQVRRIKLKEALPELSPQERRIKLKEALSDVLSESEKINVPAQRHPYRKIVNRAGEGFAYGVAAGCILGLVYCAYTQPTLIKDTVYTVTTSGIGFGLAGASWYGTRQAAKEFYKRNLPPQKT